MWIIIKLHFRQKGQHYNQKHIKVEHFQKDEHWKHQIFQRNKCIYQNTGRDKVWAFTAAMTEISSFPLS